MSVELKEDGQDQQLDTPGVKPIQINMDGNNEDDVLLFNLKHAGFYQNATRWEMYSKP